MCAHYVTSRTLSLLSPLLFPSSLTRAREKKQKNAKISEKQKKNAFLFVNNNKYHHELLLFAEKRRSSCDDAEHNNDEY